MNLLFGLMILLVGIDVNILMTKPNEGDLEMECDVDMLI